MKVRGDNNTITIIYRGRTFKGDLNQVGEPEKWLIYGRLITCEPVLDSMSLKDLAVEFIRQEFGVEEKFIDIMWEDDNVPDSLS